MIFAEPKKKRMKVKVMKATILREGVKMETGSHKQ